MYSHKWQHSEEKRKCSADLAEEKSILSDEFIKKEVQEEGTMLQTEDDSSPTEKAHDVSGIIYNRVKLEEDYNEDSKF